MCDCGVFVSVVAYDNKGNVTTPDERETRLAQDLLEAIDKARLAAIRAADLRHSIARKSALAGAPVPVDGLSEALLESQAAYKMVDACADQLRKFREFRATFEV